MHLQHFYLKKGKHQELYQFIAANIFYSVIVGGVPITSYTLGANYTLHLYFGHQTLPYTDIMPFYKMLITIRPANINCMFYLKIFFQKLCAHTKKLHKPSKKNHILCIFFLCVYFFRIFSKVYA